MRLCELSQKEVINICDGQRLGFIEDIEFDVCTGQICKVMIPGPCKIWGIMGRDHEYVIDYCCIRQIGEDVVLVETDTEKTFVKCKI
ncbi:MAG: YlmC/YmxH family sporulation protein [Acetivibrio sp.]